MNLHEIFGVLIAVTLLVGFYPYVVDIFKGKTKPERASWVIWAVLLATAFFTQLAEGARWSLVMPGLDFFIVSFIFILSLKYGTGGFIKRDIISLIVAAIGLILWALTKQPFSALLIVVVIDAIATYLTVVKTYQEPYTETLFSWVMSSLSGVFTILAVNILSFKLLVYPIFIFVADTAVLVTILIGRKYNKKPVKSKKGRPPIFDEI